MTFLINPYSLFHTPSAPSIVSANRVVQNTSGTSSGSVTSGSAASGELIILFMSHGQNLLQATPITWPSGFTEGGRSNPAGNRASGAWAWKVSSGSEPSTYSTSWSTGSTRSILSCLVIKDHNGFDTAYTNSQASNTNVNFSGSGTATVAPGLRLYLYSGGWGLGILTVTVATTTPACSLVLAGAMTPAGDNTNGAGSYVVAKQELTTSLASISHTISWTANPSGMHYVAFTIPVKGA